VSQVNKLVAGMLAEHFGDIWLEGEVSGFKVYPSGHLYFSLKDDESQLQAVCFRHAAQRLRFELENGLAVLAHGRLDVYAPTGKYQVVIDTVEPKGAGALQQAFEQLKKKLDNEGLFRAERKRPLPVLPRVLGMVTSPAGAALHDMITTLRRHRAHVQVLLCPVQVQGEGAAGQIAEGIAALCARADVEVIIVGRGGGSAEDLWAFNEEVVARAVAASRVPVVTGIGHEVDFTIADFVADVRAATPTAAAQLVARGWEELERRVSEQAQALLEAVQQVLLAREQSLDELARSRVFDLVAGRLKEAGFRVDRLAAAAESVARRTLSASLAEWTRLRLELARLSPVARILRRQNKCRDLADRMGQAVTLALSRQRARLGAAGAGLQALSPLASLGRGYAICRRPDGDVVSRVTQVAAGDGVSVRVSDGRIACRVERTTTETGGW
jgi:exodeoxyribonuclease VII large subunit